MQIALDLSENARWRQRFRAPSIAWARIATLNPARGLVCSNRDGIYQLYGWDVAAGTLHRLTDQPAGVVMGSISADGAYIYYLHDEQGNEIGHYFRIPWEGGTAQDITPEMPAYASFFFTESHSGRFAGFMTANQYGFQIFAVDRTGEGSPHLRYQNEHLCVGPSFSYDGEITLVATTEKTGRMEFSLEAFDTITGQKLGKLWDGPESSVEPNGFSPVAGDLRTLGTSSTSGYKRPLIWNPHTGERRDLPLDDIPGELTPWDWSPDARRVLLCQLEQAQYRLYVYDLEADTCTRLEHPAGSYSAGYFAPDGSIHVVWQDAVHPARLVALDAQDGRLLHTVLSAGESLPGRPWRSVTFSSGGVPIQAWLATPEGEGPFPTIVHTHGGPTAVQTEAYGPSSQAWLDHGFAFFSINYHGSTTFGRDFEKSIWGRLGELEVEDIAAGVEWLIGQGIARPDAIFKHGGSYGGYLTLMSLCRKPELWAGGLAIVAIADWVLMYEDQAETLRGYQRALFGGTPEEKPEQHRRSSPITCAADLQAELLVIQGHNDTRCPARQMQAFEARLRELGKPIHVHWFDAGHGSRAMEQQIEQQELMMRFAADVLARRTQSSVTQ